VGPPTKILAAATGITLSATERHMPYEITQCHVTGERAPP